VIDYDRLTLFTTADSSDFYVSFDNVAVGKAQGQGLVDAVKAAQAAGTLKGDVNVGILNGSPTDNNATLFSQGAHSILIPCSTTRPAAGTTLPSSRLISGTTRLL